MENLLVTGGAGFIGCNFVRYWLKNYPESKIIVLDALTYAGNKSNLPINHKGIRFVHGNILDQKLVENLMREVDTVVHFAAESHVDRSIRDPDAFIETNIKGTHSLLKAARLNPGIRFHHVSTDEVYGTLGPNDPPFTEENQYQPNSPYAASKAASDHLVRSYHQTYGLNVTTSNCSNSYGPYQFPEKLIPLMITNILEGKPLTIHGDGLQIRDWIYVDDHNRGIDLILRKGTPGEVYNIGGNNELTNIDIVNLLCDIIDIPAQIVHVNDRPSNDRRYAINASKIAKLGYLPMETFESGIRKTLDWYL